MCLSDNKSHPNTEKKVTKNVLKEANADIATCYYAIKVFI